MISTSQKSDNSQKIFLVLQSITFKDMYDRYFPVKDNLERFDDMYSPSNSIIRGSDGSV